MFPCSSVVLSSPLSQRELFFPLFPPLDHLPEPTGPEGEDPVHPADGGGAGPGLFQNLGIHQPLVQQQGHVKPLLALNFADNTDAKLETFTELMNNSTTEAGWLGFNRLFDSNVIATRMD